MQTDLILEVSQNVGPRRLEVRVDLQSVCGAPIYLQNVFRPETTRFNDHKLHQGPSTDAANVLPLGEGRLIIHQGTRPGFWHPEYMIPGPEYQVLMPGQRRVYAIYFTIPVLQWVPGGTGHMVGFGDWRADLATSALFALDYVVASRPQQEIVGCPGVFACVRGERHESAVAVLRFEQPVPVEGEGPPMIRPGEYDPGDRFLARVTHSRILLSAGSLPPPYDRPDAVPHGPGYAG